MMNEKKKNTKMTLFPVETETPQIDLLFTRVVSHPVCVSQFFFNLSPAFTLLFPLKLFPPCIFQSYILIYGITYIISIAIDILFKKKTELKNHRSTHVVSCSQNQFVSGNLSQSVITVTLQVMYQRDWDFCLKVSVISVCRLSSRIDLLLNVSSKVFFYRFYIVV